MATLIKRKNKDGQAFVIQWYSCGKRQKMSLPKMYTERDAKTIAAMIDQIAQCKVAGTPPDKSSQAWLDCINDDLRSRFVTAGLLADTESMELSRLVAEYFRETESSFAANTVQNKVSATNRLKDFWGPDTLVEEISQESVQSFQDDLLESFAEATVAGVVKVAHALFAWGIKTKRIRNNPFAGIKAGSMVNKDREHFVTRSDYAKLLDACPDQDWRAIIALCRIGGLRNPSETLLLKWVDVNWAKCVIRVSSPKTERYAGKGSRTVPMFPELRAELEKQWEQAEEGGSPYVITRYRDTAANMRTQLQRIIFRAGLAEWERLFHNLRGSRSCELFSEYPAHVAGEWMGQSSQVALLHYLHATDDDIQRAVQIPSGKAVREEQTEEKLG
ncbi:MAG: tyrosine-type recombinase/integrase [Thermoguttaceae bacterium]